MKPRNKPILIKPDLKEVKIKLDEAVLNTSIQSAKKRELEIGIGYNSVDLNVKVTKECEKIDESLVIENESRMN